MFEGFVGIRLWDGQWINDVIFGMVFMLFVCFAIVFHANYRLFLKMLNDMIHLKERQHTFGVTGGREWFLSQFHDGASPAALWHLPFRHSSDEGLR